MLDIETLETIKVAEHIFSIGCSALICLSFLMFDELRTPGFRLVFYISTCDALANLQYVAYHPTPITRTPECFTQAILVSFFVAAAVLWSLAISLTIYSTVLAALGRPNLRLKAFVDSPLKLHTAVWGLSATLALLPLTTDSTGASAGPICWLVLPSPWGNFWLLVTAYGLVWITICISLYVALRVRWEIQAVVGLMGDTGNKESRLPAGFEKMMGFFNSLKWYPLILIVAWAPSSAVRIYQMQGKSAVAC